MIMKYLDYVPNFHDNCYVTENANVWSGTIIRRDENFIGDEADTNI